MTFTILVLAQVGVATSYVDQAVTTLLRFLPPALAVSRPVARAFSCGSSSR